MLCRTCGTEISDKAIVCYRCGAGTTDPVRRAVDVKARRSPFAVVVAVLMLFLALYLGQASRTAADPGPWQIATAVLAGVALLILIVRVVRRR